MIENIEKTLKNLKKRRRRDMCWDTHREHEHMGVWAYEHQGILGAHLLEKETIQAVRQAQSQKTCVRYFITHADTEHPTALGPEWAWGLHSHVTEQPPSISVLGRVSPKQSQKTFAHPSHRSEWKQKNNKHVLTPRKKWLEKSFQDHENVLRITLGGYSSAQA